MKASIPSCRPLLARTLVGQKHHTITNWIIIDIRNHWKGRRKKMDAFPKTNLQKCHNITRSLKISKSMALLQDNEWKDKTPLQPTSSPATEEILTSPYGPVLVARAGNIKVRSAFWKSWKQIKIFGFYCILYVFPFENTIIFVWFISEKRCIIHFFCHNRFFLTGPSHHHFPWPWAQPSHKFPGT